MTEDGFITYVQYADEPIILLFLALLYGLALQVAICIVRAATPANGTTLCRGSSIYLL